MEFKRKNVIINVEEDSIASECEIETGDILHSINGKEIHDILDYRYLMSEENLIIEIEKKDGSMLEVEIEDHDGSDLGMEFEEEMLDNAKRCNNKCIFCFIDQLPKGLRETLYFKDDDSRLSFLQGNFVTLTNMSESDINRIIEYKISPINVSVHTTDKNLRVFMLKNKNSGDIFERLERLAKGGISINVQIVSIPGINNGDNLIKTVEDLYTLYPNVKNVAVVPIGITKYRDNLTKLNSYTKEEALLEIKNMKKLQEKFLSETNENFVRLADEFYIISGEEIPSKEYYGDFEQLEDGIGMIRYFDESINFSIDDLKENNAQKYKVITGEAAFNHINEIMQKINKEKDLKIETVKIKNDFFGEKITVAGLLTAKDILRSTKFCEDEIVIIPNNMLRSGEDIFLDDMTLEEFEKETKCKVEVVHYSGEDFVHTLNRNYK